MTTRTKRCRRCSLLHALVDQRVASRLTNDQISPLDNDNRHKEGGVTGEFKDLTVAVCL